jgi:Uma2 family endonuclease
MTQEADSTRYTVQQYFDLVTQGILQPDDRVELLEGVIVAEPPTDPPHASGITRVDTALRRALGERAVIRVQQPFIVGGYSVPEPDVAVVPGTEADYDTQHPTQALLIVEVAASSLPQDRLTKSRIYAAAQVPEYWVINLRDRCVEVFRDPDAAKRLYRKRQEAQRGDGIDLAAMPDVSVRVDELLPGQA